ncbi:XRE family transcriptional regulator [Streptomyces olivaceus]|uniref:XRE family transcriptional regulator n=1 Tax=Streptomyces olivaceus TaxID=47716 RepID=UPI0008791748|nr:hypothetical protein BC342_35135 [Streptomyces olivaceus]
MGRHEHELTARAVEMAEVARQLRLMRGLAGLTYDRLSQATGLSVTQLRRAANGWRTPWPVVEKFALGCGADPLAVQQQWQDAMSTPEAASFGIDRVRDIATMEELREAMQELLSASGLSLRRLSQRAPVGMLPRTTLNDALRGHARLRKDLVEAFVKALQLGTEQETAWDKAWQRASQSRTVRRRTLQLTPSPSLLRSLADIEMPRWNCLATFVDRALDGQEQARGPESGPAAPLEISISFCRDADTGNGAIVVRDQGAGMNQSELLESVRMNWARSEQSPTGVAFNVAMHRLGSVVTVRTARREDAAWSVLTLDLRALLGTGEWTVPLHLESKQQKDEHGTEIAIGHLRLPARHPRELSRLHARLGDIYSYLIREGRLRLTLDERPVAPRLPCAWDPARSVQLRGGPVAAQQEIDVTLATVQRCQDCEETFSLDADACGECGGRRLVPLPHRVWGWLGVQRYLHPTDYGIDFFRNGRKILARDKSLFSWTDDDGEEMLEYPLESSSRGGRIIGEIHCDHVPAVWSKESFVTDSASWRSVVRVVRGRGPLSPGYNQRHGYPVNTSPLAVLFQAFRRSDPGLRYLVPGDGKRALHDKAREWGAAFHRGESGFQSDQVWYDAAAAHEAQRLLRPAPDLPVDVDRPLELLQHKHRAGSSAARHGPDPRAPQAVLRCEYLFDREARTNKHGRTDYRSTHQRLRVSNIGAGPADRLRITVEAVGDGDVPVILNARGDGSVLEVDRLLGRTHVGFPVARTWGTAAHARLTLRWEEDGDGFHEVQSIAWS